MFRIDYDDAALVLVTNNGYDSILRLNGGVIVSEWSPVGGQEVAELLATTDASGWDVQRYDGIQITERTLDDDTVERPAEIADYGTPVLALVGLAHERFISRARSDRRRLPGTLIVFDEHLAQERAEYYGIALPTV